MNKFSSLKGFYVSIFVMICVLCIVGNSHAYAVASGTITPGVEYENHSFKWNGYNQDSNIVEVDMKAPNIKVEPGISDPLTDLNTTTGSAKYNTFDQHHVVGAINASFYHFDSKLPAYLVAQNNRVSTLGVISNGFNEYMSVPSAFGINAEGKGIIDTFDYDSTFSINGVKKSISSINKMRGAGEVILYTPTFSYESTRTNSYGMEIVVTNLSQPFDEGVTFGDAVTGTVREILPYGKGNATIPEDGVVISIQGGQLSSEFGELKAGQSISLTVDVDSRWKDAEFILASGPLLVQKGKVDMTIDPNSSRALTRNPRTAVGMNQDGTKLFMVTVDGRQDGYSEGMTLQEFSSYLVSLGAYQALNLDGGGSTSMAVRKPGDIYPTLVNSPSSGYERTVSTILQAVNTAPYGKPTHLMMKTSNQKMLVGGTSSVMTTSILDENYHRLTTNTEGVTYSVEGNIGKMKGNQFIAENPGSGYIVGTYQGAVEMLPITVLEAPATVKVSPSNQVITPDSKQVFTLSAFDQDGNELKVDQRYVQWWSTNGIGTINSRGEFTASDVNKVGKIQGTLFGVRGEASLRVVNNAMVLSGMNASSDWTIETIRARASITFPGTSEPYYEGNTSMKLSYDFTNNANGTAAAYVTAKTPIQMPKPTYIGLWVYGDGNNHWLRGKLTDKSGNLYTINFTEEGELSWRGWRYVRTPIPASISGPVVLNQIYVTEPVEEKQDKGTIYFDKLQAEYGGSYLEQIYKDVPNDFWAQKEIKFLSNEEIITGYSNGMFKPNVTLSREHAAVLLARVLDLSLNNLDDPGYSDVHKDHLYYKEIAAVEKAGVMSGKNNGEYFDPQGLLTRSQMAAIIYRAYHLSGTIDQPFIDVPSDFWAYKEIHALAGNGITTGYEDHSFKPNNFVTRGQFSAFLYRAIHLD